MDRSREQRSSRRSTSAAASMAALAAAAAAGEGADSAGEVTHVDEDQSQPTTLVGAAAGGAPVVSSLSSPPPPTEAVPVTAARRGGGAAGGGYGGPSCQADRCGVDLTEAKRYHRRHKVCETHSRAPVVIVAGLRQRFCQQCSRFQDLSEFDENRRSCRRRLAGHNERRRKGAMDPHPGDQDGRGHPHPGNNLLIT